MTQLKKQIGFSLVEVMVVVAIIGITASIAMPSYSAWISNTKVRTATESILNGIQKARSEALLRNTAVSFTLGANSSWTVQCVTATTCGVLDARSNEEGGTQEVVINSGGNTSLVFTNLGIRSTTAANPITTVDVSLVGADRPLRVTVGGGGNVRMCDPSTGTNDPRRC